MCSPYEVVNKYYSSEDRRKEVPGLDSFLVYHNRERRTENFVEQFRLFLATPERRCHFLIWAHVFGWHTDIALTVPNRPDGRPDFHTQLVEDLKGKPESFDAKVEIMYLFYEGYAFNGVPIYRGNLLEVMKAKLPKDVENMAVRLCEGMLIPPNMWMLPETLSRFVTITKCKTSSCSIQ